MCSGMDAPVYALKKALPKHDIDHVFSAEVDAAALRFLRNNHAPKHVYGDITKLSMKALPHVDLFVAGPPCQSFSAITASTEKAMRERVDVFAACLRYILLKQPKQAVIENVAIVRRLVQASLGQQDRRLFQREAKADSNPVWDERVTPLLKKIARRFHIFTQVLSPHECGCPQHRKRTYIVFRRKDLFDATFHFHFPPKQTTTTTTTTTMTVFDIVDKNDKTEYYKLTENTKRVAERAIRGFCSGEAFVVSAKTLELRAKHGQPPRRDPNVSDCVIACGRHILLDKGNVRALSIEELLALQGFEPQQVDVSGLSYTQMNKLVGNAMNVALLQRLFGNFEKKEI